MILPLRVQKLPGTSEASAEHLKLAVTTCTNLPAHLVGEALSLGLVAEEDINVGQDLHQGLVEEVNEEGGTKVEAEGLREKRQGKCRNTMR